MKKYIRKLWVRFLIKQLKKGAINSESVARILVHYTLIEMQKRKQTDLELEYSCEGNDTKLIILGYLTNKE